VSPSLARRFTSRNFTGNAERLGFQTSNIVVQFLFKKRLTAELTWGETVTRKLKETTRRDKKVAVSPSRPMICYAACD